MAASVTFSEFNGAGSTQTTELSNINFGTNDSANLTPATYPITAGSNSYEKYIKIDFGGTFNYVGSVYFWKSAGDYKTNELIKITGSSTTAPSYAAPVMTTSTVATANIGTSQPATMNVHIKGTVIGSLTEAGSSDYIVMQLQTQTDTEPGDVNQKTLTVQWTEA